jgi:c-di-GMP-binding flagellar brake protein YcgR
MISGFTDSFRKAEPLQGHPEQPEIVYPGQRRAARRRPPRRGPFAVTALGHELRLLNFSDSGMAVLIPSGTSLPLDGRLTLTLHQNDHHLANLSMRIVHASPCNEGTVVGGVIERCVVAAASPSRPPEIGDIVEIRDENFKAGIFDRITATSLPATIRLVSDRLLRCVLSAAPGLPSTFLVRMDESELPIGQLVNIELELHKCELTLRGTITADARGEMILRPPWRVLSLARRRCGRVHPPAELAVLEWQDPLDPDKKRVGRVVDISSGGIAVAVKHGTLQLLPSPPFPVALRAGDAVVTLLAEVHHCSQSTEDESLVGLAISPLREADRIRLTEICQSIRCRGMVKRSAVGVGAVSDLMRASGYLNLRDGAVPDTEWHTLPCNESLSIDSVYLDERGELLGHLSCLRLYPRTWLYHQLATSNAGRLTTAYLLYLQALEWTVAMAGEDGFGLAYFDQGKPWHKLLFSGFVRWIGAEALAVTSAFDRLEAMSEPSDAPAAPSFIVVEVAKKKRDLSFVVRLARAATPPLLADALHFDLDAISTEWLCDVDGSAGLERARVTFVAGAEGGILGAAICETGPRRLSLFNIVNVAHVFIAEPLRFGLAREVERALLSKVRQFYRAKGILDPLIVAPEGNVKFPESAGLCVAETMGVWVTSIEGLKQYRNFLHFELGERTQGFRKKVSPNSDASGDRPWKRNGDAT